MADAPYTRRKPDESEEWALTFADMMTLLLCFFVLLLSIAQVDTTRFETVTDSLQNAMGGGAAKRQAATPTPQAAQTAEPEAGASLFDLQIELAARLRAQRENVRLLLRPDAVLIELKDVLLFPSGSAALSDSARPVLAAIAEALSGGRYAVVVEGHTDDVPIHSAAFPSNWELSGARAASVARALIDQGLPKDRTSIAGLADTRPVAPNTDASGNAIPANQARNRRIVILVKPEAG